MKRLFAFALMAALLAGCGAATSSRPVCLALAPYAPAKQTQAAEELDALSPTSALRSMIEDYGDLRARMRAACAG